MLREEKTNLGHAPVTYEEIVESLEDFVIFTIDKENKITSWNAGSERLLGYTEKEVIGKPVTIIFVEEDILNNVSVKETEIALKEGRSIDERWHLKKDKSKFFAFGLTFPLRDNNGKWIGFVKIFRDLTERKKSEEALAHAFRELQELNTHKEKIMSVLSHDLRAPLSSIIGSTNVLIENYESMDKAEIFQMLSLVNKSTKKIVNMLDDLVNWAKVKHTVEIFSPEKVNLRDIMSNSYKILAEYASQKDITFINNVEEDIYISADKKMMLSIFKNLFSNAIKFSPLRGQITAYAFEKEEKVVVRITDSGVGMPKELQKNYLNQSQYLLKEGL